MKKSFNTGVFILIFSITTIGLFAQEETNFEFIESGNVRIEAEEFYSGDDPDYSKAIELISKIDENDTNYYNVQYDIAYFYYLDSNDANCVETCNKALLRPNDRTSDFINIKGLALKRQGNYEDAIALYLKYIQEYPKDYLLYSNLANSYYKNKQYQKAYDYYKSSLKLNPYHTNNYRMLGYLLAQNGQLTAASLCYHMALLIKPKAESATDIIFYIEKMMSNEHIKNDSIDVVDKDIPEYFDEVDQILRNRLAQNANYKTKSAFDFKVIRSSQVMCEKLQDPGNDTTYWNRYVIRNFFDIWSNDIYEGYSYYFFQSLTNTSLKKQIEKRSGAIEKFQNWAKANITVNLLIDRRKAEDGFTPTQLSFYKNNHLYGYGPVNDDFSARINDWNYFHTNGRLFSEGEYDEKGERIGEWNWYLENGLRKETANYKDGKMVGIYKKYNAIGLLTQQYTYNEESNISGDVFLYYDNGVKSGILQFKDGKRNGLEKKFHSNGEVKFTLNYENGIMTGDYESYYDNGQVTIKAKYEEDEMVGDYISYHRNGKVLSTGQMTKGEMTGAWEFFYDNGILKKEAEYKKGSEIGEVKSYYKNGKLKSVKVLDEAGKENGSVKGYDQDGVLYETYEYNKGIISAIRYFDKKGRLTHNFEREKAILEFESYTPRGVIDGIGSFDKKGRVGHWTYHTEIGVKESEMDYVDGKLEGEYLVFHPNGKVRVRQFYNEGVRDSAYIKYHQNGRLHHVGYFIDGDLQGLYYITSPQGDTLEKEYYVEGQIHGRNHYYVRGKNGNKQIKRTYTYYMGTLMGVEEYDENGNVINEKKFDKGNGKLELHYPNGELYSVQNYENGIIQGKAIYYWGGKVRLSAQYKDDQRQGNWTWYKQNGNKSTEGNYDHGDQIGRWVNYYDNENPYWVRNYTDDQLNGLDTFYHENGNISTIANRVDDEREGASQYFSPNGTLYFVRYYYKGEVIGYSYPDANGKLKPMIELEKGNGKVLAYFPNGKKAFEVEYVNGAYHGPYKVYYSNGKLWKSIPQFYGENEGVRKEYYESGVLKSEEMMKSGNYEGESKYYYSNGKTEQVSQFWNDEKHGTTLLYDESGKLTKTQTWFEGELMDEI